jgi:hypothetical protein
MDHSQLKLGCIVGVAALVQRLPQVEVVEVVRELEVGADSNMAAVEVADI